MTLKERIQNLILNEPEDINKIDEICEEYNANNNPKELIDDLFMILEKNPHYDFWMLGNLMRTIKNIIKNLFIRIV
jgi:hypothetical protein